MKLTLHIFNVKQPILVLIIVVQMLLIHRMLNFENIKFQMQASHETLQLFSHLIDKFQRFLLQLSFQDHIR